MGPRRKRARPAVVEEPVSDTNDSVVEISDDEDAYDEKPAKKRKAASKSSNNQSDDVTPIIDDEYDEKPTRKRKAARKRSKNQSDDDIPVTDDDFDEKPTKKRRVAAAKRSKNQSDDEPPAHVKRTRKPKQEVVEVDDDDATPATRQTKSTKKGSTINEFTIEDMQLIFAELDQGSKGYLTADDFLEQASVLGEAFQYEELQAMLAEADQRGNRNGRCELGDFIEMSRIAQLLP